jgi:hypothetical protein
MPNDEKTWKSAKVEQIQYKGKDGIINIKQMGESDSLGSLYNWDRVERFDEFVFRGDDIIYSEKNGRSNAYIDGFEGDDILYLYGGENARGGKGKDKFLITKEAVKYMKTRKRDFGHTDIDDVSFAEGDEIEIFSNPDSFNLYTNGRELQYETDFARINIESKQGRVLAGFV